MAMNAIGIWFPYSLYIVHIGSHIVQFPATIML